MVAVTVLMPTYNASKYVAEAIESVLKQSFEDWELIIVDDGSTDNTVDIIRSYTDSRIRLICNEHDFIGSLNLGLKESSGKYIARMDADDIMHPDRLKIQYNIMEEEPEITVCGSWVKIFSEKRPPILPVSLNGRLDNIYLYLLKQNPLYHPTIMMRGDFLRMYNILYENYKYAEDYKLWFEIAKLGGVFFIESQPLLYYRMTENQVSKLYMNEKRETALRIRNEVLQFLMEKNEDNIWIHLLREGLELAEKEGTLASEEVYDIWRLVFSKIIINH